MGKVEERVRKFAQQRGRSPNEAVTFADLVTLLDDQGPDAAGAAVGDERSRSQAGEPIVGGVGGGVVLNIGSAPAPPPSSRDLERGGVTGAKVVDGVQQPGTAIPKESDTARGGIVAPAGAEGAPRASSSELETRDREIAELRAELERRPAV